MNLRNLYLLPWWFVLSACVPMVAPEIRVTSAQLLTERTLISDGQGNGIYFKGLLVFTVESEIDLFAQAAKYDAKVISFARHCDSGIDLSDLYRVYKADSKEKTYWVLVDYKSNKIYLSMQEKPPPYNFALQPEDVCIQVGFGRKDIFQAAALSSPIRYPLSESLRETLRTYEQQGGEVKWENSPDCPDTFCTPYYYPF